MSKDHLPSKTHAHLASVYALMTAGPVLDGPEVGHHGGMTARRASDALKRLAGLGAVQEGAPQVMGWQRPQRPGSDPDSTYCLSNEWGYALGVAAGHRGVGTGLIDACGRFREHGSSATECRVDQDLVIDANYWKTLNAIVEQILECVRRRQAQLAELGSPARVDVRAITVGLPGQITAIRQPDAGQRRVATILTKFARKPVAGDLGTILAQHESDLPFDPRMIPISLENDADCAAVGELHWGEGQGCRSLLVVKVSAGIGAGVIVDGSIHYGHQATTGEIGHDRVHPALLDYLNRDLPDGLERLEPDSQILRCSCALADSSHLEAYASATAVMCRVLGRRRRDIDVGSWRDSLSTIIRAAVVDGDEKAERAIRDAGLLVGQQINTLANALGPERVLITGPLNDAGALFLGPIHDEIETLEAPITHAPRDVRFGTGGEAARWIGVNGAARMALEQGVWGPKRVITGYEWPGYRAAEAFIRPQARPAPRR